MPATVAASISRQRFQVSEVSQMKRSTIVNTLVILTGLAAGPVLIAADYNVARGSADARPTAPAVGHAEEQLLREVASLAKQGVQQADSDMIAAQIALATAANIAEQIKDERLKAFALSYVVQAQIAIKDFLAARETAQLLANKGRKSSLLAAVIKAQADAGDIEGARATLEVLGQIERSGFSDPVATRLRTAASCYVQRLEEIAKSRGR